MKNHFSLLLVALLSLSFSAAAAPLSVKVYGITDGDTLVASVGSVSGETIRVRLAEIDAPEPGQPYSDESFSMLSRLCGAMPELAQVETQGKDRDGRILGHVTCSGKDANTEMVRSGMAWVDDQSVTDQRLYQLQDEARAARRGLWADSSPTPPWAWHKSREELKRRGLLKEAPFDHPFAREIQRENALAEKQRAEFQEKQRQRMQDRFNLTSKVTGVPDGDTLEMLRDGKPIKVRLSGIAAPKWGLPYSEQSRRALSSLCLGKTASIETMGKTPDGYFIGRLGCGANNNVPAQMLHLGMAWVNRPYLLVDPDFYQIQYAAYAARRGLWADTSAIPPPVPKTVWRRSQAGTRGYHSQYRSHGYRPRVGYHWRVR